VLVVAVFALPVTAGPSTQVVREATEFVLRKFGKQAAQEGAEALTRRIAAAAGRHGDDVLRAVKNCGPRSLRLIEEAGEHAAAATRALATHGERAAVSVATRPSALKLVTRYGDDVTEACVRHAGLAEPLVEKFGGAGAKALAALNPQGGKHL